MTTLNQFYMPNLFFSTSLRNNILLLCLALVSVSCNDIFEKDISSLKVNLVAPGDSVSSGTTLVSFRWDAIDVNSFYRLQISSPNFASPVRFVLDTLVTATKFDYELSQGAYEWQVRGENNSSQTAYSRRTLTIDSITDLSKQEIVLTSPADKIFTGDSSITFTWNKSDLATTYSIQVFKGSVTGTPLYSKSEITATQITVPLTEGTFVWRVRGVNDITATTYSKPFTVKLDLTRPETSIPDSPAPDTLVNSFPLNFKWTKPLDTGSPISDSLFIYFINGNPLSAYQPKLISTNSYSVDTLPPGSYSWRLRSVDAAGNAGSYSVPLKFTVQ